jgi:hypothetical protein
MIGRLCIGVGGLAAERPSVILTALALLGCAAAVVYLV